MTLLGEIEQVGVCCSYQEAMRGCRREQGRLAAEVELVGRRRGGREQQAAEVDGEQVGAVAAAHRHRLEEAAARNADLRAQINTK
jgi:hypothetical protein